jgi:hypothetical protein
LPTAQKVGLLVSADRTENISRGCYCCVATNCHRCVFTSALRSNKRGEARLLFLLLRAFRGFCGSAVLALGKYATIPYNGAGKILLLEGLNLDSPDVEPLILNRFQVFIELSYN